MNETFISVDIEADGSNGAPPGEYSMLSLGAVNVDKPDQTWYAEFKPIGNKFDQRALEVCGLSREKLLLVGTDPRAGMARFSEWARSQGQRPIFVSYSTWDWAMVWYYLQRYLSNSPFSHSSLDIKSYYMGFAGTSWRDTAKRRIKEQYPELLEGLPPHTHNALEDAKEQAILFKRMRDWK